MKKPVALIIMDGFGESKNTDGNAIASSNTPNLDKIMNEYPHTLIQASGLDVGLPDGQMGNSEVGHTNIGAGRIVYQDLTRVSKAIEDGDFFTNEVLLKAMENAKEHSLHLMGLLSNGGVHSHIDHLKALVKMAKENGVENVFVHAFTDGRDVDPRSALEFIEDVENYMKEVGVGKIASVSGRYYAMDRDKRWERVQLAYDAMVNGKGNTATSAKEAIEKSYADDKNDEFVVPTVIVEDGKPLGLIKEGDYIGRNNEIEKTDMAENNNALGKIRELDEIYDLVVWMFEEAAEKMSQTDYDIAAKEIFYKKIFDFYSDSDFISVYKNKYYADMDKAYKYQKILTELRKNEDTDTSDMSITDENGTTKLWFDDITCTNMQKN